MKSLRYVLSIYLLFSATVAWAQTGKIAGKVIDARTGEAIVGANVVVDGTSYGASSNVDGFFTILSVPPGSYMVRASVLGYTPAAQVDVHVFINQTTQLEFRMSEAAIQAQEVVIVASRPIVERDVAASRANISAREVENLPISQVSSVIGLEAGVQTQSNGVLLFRGSDANQSTFLADGIAMKDERNNQPYTSLSLLAIQEYQIQTGGFSAEYGNIRSGLINVVTKEGSPKKYSIGAILRYSPPTQKYFGMKPNDPNSYWIRPMMDPAVAWTGTANGNWDPWTREQYRTFEGWNSVSQKLLSDTDPTNDLTPQAAQQVFLWQHRKNFDITKPDFTADFGLGGPVPGGEYLGNLRFYASFRSTNTEYAIPLSRDATTDYSTTLKVTSDLSNTMKLMVEATVGRTEGVDANQNAAPGSYGNFLNTEQVAANMNQVSYIDCRLFTNDYYAPNAVDRTIIGAKFTHVLSPTTFYEVVAQSFSSRYSTNPGRSRDLSRVYLFGNSYYLDEAPFGFTPNPAGYSLNSIDGMRMAVGMSNSRDSSKIDTYEAKFDMVSQVDRYNEIKGGIDYGYTVNQVNYGSVDLALQAGRTWSHWKTYPVRLEAYLKDKLEFEGMIVDAGLRLAMSHAGGEWFTYDPFTKVFRGFQSYGADTLLPQQATKYITNLMPRLNIAFPISENAKLYFNYGHFRALPTPENLYLIRHENTTGDIVRLADPNLPLEKTVAYELGYEHNLFDMFLLRIAAYYKDISDERYLVENIGYGSVPDYTVSTANLYEDIRGFEITLRKNRGNWLQGFVNYTYSVTTSGHFGWPVYNQSQVDQINYELGNPPIQNVPIPQPYARANLDIFTPSDFGSKFAGIDVLGEWRLSVLASWNSGNYFTWVGGGSFPGVANNIKWVDTYSCDLRLSKNFQIGPANLQLFVDINNALNLKQMSHYGFYDATDYTQYLMSLHLPGGWNADGTPNGFDQYYGNIPGDDKPGNYRKAGVDYQPMVYSANIKTIASPYTRPIYYDKITQQYYRWINNQWAVADPNEVNKVLNDKAYIHMPTQDWFTFLNPRDVYFGARISFDVF